MPKKRKCKNIRWLWKCAYLGLTFRRTNVRLENETDLEQLKSKIKAFDGEFPVVFTHERYLAEADMQLKIAVCLQVLEK